jgi:hypothetical protein
MIMPAREQDECRARERPACGPQITLEGGRYLLALGGQQSRDLVLDIGDTDRFLEVGVTADCE